MNKSLKRIVNVIFVILISITFIKCQQEDNLAQSKTTDILLAQKWFENYETNSDNYTLFQNLDYKWSDAKIKNSGDGTETIIIPINASQKDVNQEQKLYIYKLGKNNYKALLFEIYQDQKNTATDNSFESGNFNGYISAWDLKQGFVKAARFANDKVVENGFINVSAKINKITNKAPNLAPCPAGTYCGDGDSGGDDNGVQLKEVVINNNYQSPTIYYLVYYSGSGSGGITDTGTGAYTNHSAGNGIAAPTSVEIIDQLIGKAKCLNALLNKNGNSFVQKLLSNFVGSSDFDIKIVSVDKIISDKTGLEINGTTAPPKNKVIEIKISTSKMNSNSALDAVRTILHEYIHADIYRKLNITPTTEELKKEKLDFKSTYNFYGNQHGIMGSLYINSMKEALKEFHKNVLTEDYNKYVNYYGEEPSDAFYEALAWGGLKDNDVKAWTDLPSDKKTSIENLAKRANLLTKTTPCQ